MVNIFKKAIVTLLVMFSVFSAQVMALETDNVIDKLDYLTQSEVSSIQNKIEQIQNKFNLDVAIVITDDVEGKSSMEYADDYYDYNGYGLDNNASGFLMLINMEHRDVWISTTGRGIQLLTDARIENILDSVIPHMSDGDYYKASTSFLKYVDRYASGKGDNIFLTKLVARLLSPSTFLISITITVLLTLGIVSSDVNGRRRVHSTTYVSKKGFSVTNREDTFLGKNITKTKKEKYSGSSSGSSSGGSTTHRGSSGIIHGGGGRRF